MDTLVIVNQISFTTPHVSNSPESTAHDTTVRVRVKTTVHVCGPDTTHFTSALTATST